MSDSATSSTATSRTAGASLLTDRCDDESRLRRAVIAGPGEHVEAGDAILGGILAVMADDTLITAGLAAAGHIDRRRRILTGLVTVAAILGLCLYRRENYDLVLARILPVTPRLLIDGRPTGQALSAARVRLAPATMRHVFMRAAADMPAAGPESFAFGLLLTGFDGTVLDLPAGGDITDVFTAPSGGKYPQARLVTLVTCGTRWIIAAAHGSSGLSEQHLVDQLVDTVAPGTLNLSDRNFFSMDRWIRFTATGAHLAWRVKNGSRSLPARITAVLPDGSVHVRLRESDSMLAYRRAKAGDRSLTRLPDTIARLVEFILTVTDEHARSRTTRFRILTTVLDHEHYPADQIAAVYAERWQVEIVYLRLKVTLRGAGTRLRAQTPHLVDQEIWGLLTVYNALVGLAVTAAVALRVDPDDINFAAVPALTRTTTATRPPCTRCGHPPEPPVEDLIAAISAQPRNRSARQRTSPRTRAQRRTERTRNVTYTITIETPKLPIAP